MLTNFKKMSNDDLYEYVWQSGIDNPEKTRKKLIKQAKTLANEFRSIE